MTHETGATTATYLRSQQGSLLSQQGINGTHIYGKDRLGSVTALVGTNGTVANTYSYSPYGYPMRQTGTVTNPWTFTGAYRDSATYYQMGARSYQQATGRFTQQDPLPSSIFTYNRYAYTGGNPVNLTDPTGLYATNCYDGVGSYCYQYFSPQDIYIAGGGFLAIGLVIPVVAAYYGVAGAAGAAAAGASGAAQAGAYGLGGVASFTNGVTFICQERQYLVSNGDGSPSYPIYQNYRMGTYTVASYPTICPAAYFN